MPTATESGIALLTVSPADRVALRGVRVRSRLSGLSQRTTVEQTFINREDRAIEAVYTFPLPESAAVCGFEVVTGDHVLTGTIDEAEHAVEKYEKAVSEGHGAFMVEQERPDVFTVRVGNLKPRQAATIRLTYVAPLEKADKSIRLTFPTAIAPRYATYTDTDPLDAMIDDDALNPPHVLSVPYGLSLELEIDLGRDLNRVTAPSHAIRTQKTEAGTTLVTLAAGVTEMNRDIVLELALAKEHQPAVQVTSGANGESYLAVTFVPEFDEDDLADPQPVETIFLLDCSGSMQGSSIEQAVAALELCLRSLSPGDTFNICRFGSSFEFLATEPLSYTQATLDKALRYIHCGADLGGTELFQPLEVLLKTKPKAGQVRQVILLTDGQVTNEPAVIDLARKHRSHSRIFSFGIGAGASQFLVKGVARATGGAAEFITEGERIEEKVLRTFARLASPMVSDVSIDWGDAEVQTLAELPPIFDGDLLAVFARTPCKPPKQVTLSCVAANGPKKWTLPVGPATQDDGVIATMWARRTIQSMEEVNGPLIRSRRGKLTREQKLLVSLSKEYNLLCGLTTFIAIEHRSMEERNEGKPELRRVPVALVKDWGGVEQQVFGAGPACAAPMSAPVPCAPAPMRRMRQSGGPIMNFLGGAIRGISSFKKAMQTPPDLASLSDADDESPAAGGSDTAFGAIMESIGPDAPPTLDAIEMRDEATIDPLHALLALQAADGSFDWNDAAEAMADPVWRATFRSTMPRRTAGADDDRVLNTVCILLLLAEHFADRKTFWRRARQKAVRQYLAPAFGMKPAEVEAWLASVEK